MKSTSRRDASDFQKPRLLYIDMAYTLEMVKERELDQFVAARECGGYFDHVWSVHPFADVPNRRKPDLDGFKISTIEFSKRQTLIEGASAYYPSLKCFFFINFIASQIRFFVFLLQLVKKERISIVHSEEPYFGGIIASLLKLLTRTSMVIGVVANYDELYQATGVCAFPRIFRRRWIEKIIENIVFRYADLVAGVNRNNLEYAVNNGANSNKTVVFTFGRLMNRKHQVESKLREKDELFSAVQAAHFFVYVGRLLELKHPDDVVRAFAVINQGNPKCALIIAGDGPMRIDLEKLAFELGVSNKVHFLGNIGQSRLTKLLAGCFAYLSPLTGGALVEAALAGLPVIAYDRDWQGEFIGDNAAGVLVPFREWRKMGEAAVDLLSDPERVVKMGAEARRKGLELTDLTKIYAVQRTAFEKMLRK